MGKVLYMRHGESVRNKEGVFAGGTDNTPLTNEGRQQAYRAGLELCRQEKIDRIITSSLDRTRDTAQIVAQASGIDSKLVKVDPRLREYELGDGNGQSVVGMTAAKMVAFEGAEDPDVFAERVEQALRNTMGQEGVTLIVSHGGVGRLIECLRQGLNPATFYNLPGYPNAHAIELDLDWLS